MDIHQNQVGRYELGTAQPNADSIVCLAKTLGVSTDFLLNGESADTVSVSLDNSDILEMFRRAEKLPAE